MTARYWVAKHIADVFRNEPRNVGVIVDVDGALQAQFLAEREDGSFDGRTLRQFEHSSIYLEWVSFWRDELASGSLDYLLRSYSANFTISEGGEVRGYQGDDSAEVCEFLYTSLVGRGIVEAFDWDRQPESAVLHLEQDVAEEFSRYNLISDGYNLLVRNPVQRHRPVSGRHAVHTPDFVQTNGHLAAFETVDFTLKQHQRIRDRAGWAAYMFSDIKEAQADFEAFAIVRAPEHLTGEALDYAAKMLASKSVIVNWQDASDRTQFVEERVRVADVLRPIELPTVTVQNSQ